MEDHGFVIDLEGLDAIDIDTEWLYDISDAGSLEDSLQDSDFHYSSPFLINDMSYEDFIASQSLQAKLYEQQQRQIELMNGAEKLY